MLPTPRNGRISRFAQCQDSYSITTYNICPRGSKVVLILMYSLNTTLPFLDLVTLAACTQIAPFALCFLGCVTNSDLFQTTQNKNDNIQISRNEPKFSNHQPYRSGLRSKKHKAHYPPCACVWSLDRMPCIRNSDILANELLVAKLSSGIH